MKRSTWIFICIFSSELGFAQTGQIDSLQRIIALQRHDTTEINALISLTFEFSRKDLVKTQAYANQAVSLARALHDDRQLGNGYFYLVSCHQNNGKRDSAVYYLDLLGKLSAKNPTMVKMAANYNQAAGLFYKNSGEPKKALVYKIGRASCRERV